MNTKGYFAFPRSFHANLSHYSPKTIATYLFLYGQVPQTGQNKGVFRGTLREIAESVGISKDSVARALKELNDEVLQVKYAENQRKKTVITLNPFITPYSFPKSHNTEHLSFLAKKTE